MTTSHPHADRDDRDDSNTSARRARAYRQLLRLYPRRWRRINGDVLFSALTEDAERADRAEPSLAEWGSAAVHGLAARLDRRWAVAASCLGLIVMAAVTLLMGPLVRLLPRELWSVANPLFNSFAWVSPVAFVGLLPACAMVVLLVLLRERGILSDGRALLTLVTSLAALVLASSAVATWVMATPGRAFDVPGESLLDQRLESLIVAWGIGAAALALLFDALLARVRMPRRWRIVVAVLAAVAAGLGLGTVLHGGVVSATALITVTIALVMTGGELGARESRSARDEASSAPRSAPLSLVRDWALVSVAVGLVGIAYYELVPPQPTWSNLAEHPERAMHLPGAWNVALAILLIAVVPLLAAVGQLVVARGRVRAAHTWGPFVLVTAALCVESAGLVMYKRWHDNGVGWGTAASLLVGAAVVWWLWPRVRVWGLRAVLSVLTGVACVGAVPGVLNNGLLFAVPVVAFALAVGAALSARRASGRERNRPMLVSVR